MSKRRREPASRNLPLALAMVGKRSSGAAGKHADKRDKRARTRGAQKARVMKEW